MAYFVSVKVINTSVWLNMDFADFELIDTC